MRVAESPVNVECRLVGTKDFGGGSVVVYGEVVWVSVDEQVLDGDHPEVRRLAPIARLGRNEWGAVGEVSERRRVPYAEMRERA